MDDRYKKILGLEENQPKTEYVCFLPWASEFGWYIMNHVKRFHGYNHTKKIACIKPGHECLFPSAVAFYYDWIDNVPDSNKGGVVKYSRNTEVRKKIVKKFGSSVTFVDPADTSWDEKTSLAHHTFVPKPLCTWKFDVDVIVTPRLRQIEKTRNYPKQWQSIVDGLLDRGYRVGVCGSKELSTAIEGAHYYAWDYKDVDGDVGLILNSKLVVGQESGLAYLTMMCKKPLIIIDQCYRNVADKHRDPNVYFNVMPWVWNSLDLFYEEVGRVVGSK